MKNLFFSVLFFVLLLSANLATGQVGIGTTTPDGSAQLEIVSNKKGLLIPRMDMNARTDIPDPAVGLLVYQTDNDPGFYYFDGTLWAKLGAPTAAPPANFAANASTLTPDFALSTGPINTNWTVVQQGSNGTFDAITSTYKVASPGNYKFTARLNFSYAMSAPIILPPDIDPAITIVNNQTSTEYARGVFPITYSSYGPTLANSGTVIVEGTAALAIDDELTLSADPGTPFLLIALGSAAKHPNGISWTITKLD